MKPHQTVLCIALFLCMTNHIKAQKKQSITINQEAMKNETMDHNKQQVRNLYEECLNKRNYDGLKGVISDEYTGVRGERGPEGFSETVKSLIAGVPDIKWVIEDLMADGDKVIVRWSWTGTHTGNFRGFKASGKRITDHAIAIYQFKNGKAVHAWIESDRLGFLTQIGVIPVELITPPGTK